MGTGLLLQVVHHGSGENSGNNMECELVPAELNFTTDATECTGAGLKSSVVSPTWCAIGERGEN